MSKVWLNKLPAELRRELYSVGREVQPMAQKWSIDITRAWEKELWAKAGGTVHWLSAAEKKEMGRRVCPLGESHLGSNPRIKPMYELIKAAAEATR